MFYSAPPRADIWQSIIITGGNPWWRADFRWEWRTAGAHSDQSTLFLHICIRPPPARPPPRGGRKSIKGLVDTFIEKKNHSSGVSMALWLSLHLFSARAGRLLLLGYSLECSKCAGCRPGDKKLRKLSTHTETQNRAAGFSLMCRR